ncbi:ribonuclease H-like domain-containing protein [Tanacetum coccineum]
MLDGDSTEVSRMKYGSFIGSQRSKEDDVQKISTYVFVTNFPDQYGAKDLWNSCKAYGHVVDAYIPNRRSNADVGNNVNGAMGASNSYVHVVKGTQIPKEDTENDPSLVLDEPAVYLSFNLVQHQRTKYIEIDIHFVRVSVTSGQVRVLHVPSRYQYANIFTKGLPSDLLEEFQTSLSVRCPPAPTTGEC